MPPVSSALNTMPRAAADSLLSSGDSDRSGSEDREARDANTNLYVGGLHDSVRDADLAHRFQLFGKIVSAKVMLHIHTGQSRGIGFVKFETHESAVAAIQALHRSMFHGQRIMVRFADSRADFRPGDKTNKIFVRNLPFDVNVTALRNYFSVFGPIQECTLHLDTAGFKAGGHGVRTRMAYITFASVEHAETAASAVHGTRPFASCHAAVMAKLAESDTKRQERRQRQRGHSSVDEGDQAPPGLGSVATEDQHLSPNGKHHGSSKSPKKLPSTSVETSDPSSSDSSEPPSGIFVTNTVASSPSSGTSTTSPAAMPRAVAGPIKIPLPSPLAASEPVRPSPLVTMSQPVRTITAAPPPPPAVPAYAAAAAYATPPMPIHPLLTSVASFGPSYPLYGGFGLPAQSPLMPAAMPTYAVPTYAGLPGVSSSLFGIMAPSIQPTMMTAYPGYSPNPYAAIVPPGLPYPTAAPSLPLRWP